MGSNDTSDTAPLLTSHETGKDSVPQNITEFNTNEKKTGKINLTKSYIILSGIYIGTGVLVLPFTVLQLGATSWIIIMLLSLLCMFLCSHVLSISGQHMMYVNEVVKEIRDPYPAIGEFAVGILFRKLIIIFFYMATILLTVGMVLLTSTALKGLIPINNIAGKNVIRLWATLITLFLTPIMYLANYSHLVVPSIIAMTMSLSSLIAIITNSFLARYVYDINPEKRVVPYINSNEIFMIPFGSCVFAAGCLPLAIPNILALVSTPKKLTVSIFSCSMTLAFVFLISGLVPYILLGENVLPSISSTFVEIMKVRNTGILFNVLTFIVQSFMVVHLLMACVLTMNPIYLHMEEVLKVPYEMGWQRITIRTTFMIIILGTCLAIPTFKTILSLTGAVPLIFLGITFPLIIYVHVFQLEWKRRICVYICIVLSVIFAFCYLVIRIITWAK